MRTRAGVGLGASDTVGTGAFDWLSADEQIAKLQSVHGTEWCSYVHAVMQCLLRFAVPLADGERVTLEAYRLRGRVGAQAGLIPISPVSAIASPATVDRRCGLPFDELLAAHIDALLTISIPELHGQPQLTADYRLGHGVKRSWQVEFGRPSDFRFSYPLAWTGVAKAVDAYCAWLWVSLLDLLIPICNGKPLVPTEICIEGRHVRLPVVSCQQNLIGGSRAQFNKRDLRQPLHSIAATEPRIAMLARHWGLLAGFVVLSGSPAGGELSIEGFSLRALRDWSVPSSGHASEIYEYLARVCNVACKFCYLYGNPNELAVARGVAVISKDEMETRLAYYEPARGSTLFSAQWEINEFLVDPKLSSVLFSLRATTQEPFYFITNGSPLKPPVVELLKNVAPVHLMISINSISAERRGEIMGESARQSEIAHSSLLRLADAGIPFAISLAAFPEFPFHDLEQTISVASDCGAAFVRINLPGFTQTAPYTPREDLQEYWGEVRQFVRELRPRVPVPLLLIPSAFEHSENPLEPRVLGAVPGSPMYSAGLRAGDLVLAVNHTAITSRAELTTLLLLLRAPFELKVQRERHTHTLEIHSPTTPSPWTGHVLCKYLFPWGAAIAPSLSRVDADGVAQCFEPDEVHNAWIMTSKLMMPMARALIDRYATHCSQRIRLIPVENEFLGGNIQIMDMATIGDIVGTVEREIHRSRQRPDMLIVSESGFNPEGRDLQGRHWGDIERHLGIPVRLLPVSRFSF